MSFQVGSSRFANDTLYKKMADIRISPWRLKYNIWHFYKLANFDSGFIPFNFYRTQIRSLPCLVTLPVSSNLSKLIHGFYGWICQNWYRDFSDLLHGFVKIYTWISLSWYKDMSMLLRGFVKFVLWIGQNCSMYILLLGKQNQGEVWPRYQSKLKLLVWTKGVEWVQSTHCLGSAVCISEFPW